MFDEGNKTIQPLQEVRTGSLKHNAPGSASLESAAVRSKKRLISDEFEDPDIPDEDMIDAAHAMSEFEDIDEAFHSTSLRSSGQSAAKGKCRALVVPPSNREVSQEENVRLPNGNWQCHHQCKNKTSCRHLCCREGTTKKPKPRSSESQKPNSNKMTGYLDLEETTMEVPSAFLSPQKKGQGFFVSDSSSPVKGGNVPTVDLSSDVVEVQRDTDLTLAPKGPVPPESHDESRVREHEAIADNGGDGMNKEASVKNTGVDQPGEGEKDEVAAWLKSAFGDYVELVSD